MISHNLIEIANRSFSEIDFSLLLEEERLRSNPYSLIHPGYLYYLRGKLLKSRKYLEKAADILKETIKTSLDGNEYSEAGEFSILLLKIRGKLDSGSKKFERTYKKALKIFQSLSELYIEPYFLESIIEIANIYEKHCSETINLRNVYVSTISRYLTEAEHIKDPNLMNIKIMNYFQALTYLNKINQPMDRFNEEEIINKLIFEINNQLELLDKKDGLKAFTKKSLEINLIYGLGKTYNYSNHPNNAKHFINKAKRKLSQLLNEKNINSSIIESKTKLYIEKEHYRIHDLEISSKNDFQPFLVSLEKIELLDLMEQILIDLSSLGNHELKYEEEISKNRNFLIEEYEKLINLLDLQLNNNKKINKLDKTMENKYRAFKAYLIHQIIKIKRKLKEN